VRNESLDSCYLILLPKKNQTVVRIRGDQTHALFLNLIKQFDPTLSARLHHELGYRPFTISPLYGGIIVGERIVFRHGFPCHLRITLLDGGNIWNALQTYILQNGPISAHIGDIDFHLTRMLTTSSSNPLSWVGSTDWQTLETLPVQYRIKMQFSSPTTFSLGDRQFSLFPEPHLVWGSLLRSWNRYAPISNKVKREGFRTLLLNSVRVTKCSLRTKTLFFSNYTQKGFVGSCSYSFKAPDDDTALLTSLAAFAYYAGVGYKTTMGMGQVRVTFGN